MTYTKAWTVPTKKGERAYMVGERIHGFAGGAFGRDSYTCRVIEAVGPDWAVTRNAHGVVEMVSAADLDDVPGINDARACHDGQECPDKHLLDAVQAKTRSYAR